MYSVYCDGVCLYNDICPPNRVNAVSPKLEMAENDAGSLEITLPVGNAGYDVAERLTSEIVVKRDNVEIWAGRIISEQKNFQNSRILTCEGELAYLNDTTQPPHEYSDMNLYNFLEAVLDEHNSKVEIRKRFSVGAVTVGLDENEELPTVNYTTEDETTLEILSKLVEDFGGHFRVRREYDENGNLTRYLDYLKEYPNTNSQEIRFGKNLLDFTVDWDMTEFVTVIVPRGKTSSDEYLYVTDINGGSRYVINQEAKNLYGYIEAVVDFDDISDPTTLLEKAEAYIQEEQFSEMVIEVSAVDMRYLSKDAEPIKLLDQIRVISRPHGLDRIFPVTEVSIQLDKPDNSTYTLGNKVRESTLTGSTRSANEEILERVKNIPSETSTLEKAKANATQIMNSAMNGHVTILRTTGDGINYTESLNISSDRSYNPETDRWSADTKVWRWNIEGLAYSKNGGRDYTTAITSNGQIVADFVNTGILSANVIKTGIIKSENSQTMWDLDTGELYMRSGSIILGNYFKVGTNGWLTASGGTIGGYTISETAIFNSKIMLNSNGLSFRHIDSDKTYELGSYGTGIWTTHIKNEETGKQETQEYPNLKGLTMSLGNENSFMGWCHKDGSTDDAYTMKLLFAYEDLPYDDGSDKFVANRLHFCCNIDGNDWSAKNFWIEEESGGALHGMTLENGNYVSIQLTDGGWFNCRIINGFIIA